MKKLTEEESKICQRCANSLICLTTWEDNGFRRCSKCQLPYYSDSPTVAIMPRDETPVINDCPRAPPYGEHEPLCDVCVEGMFDDNGRLKKLKHT